MEKQTRRQVHSELYSLSRYARAYRREGEEEPYGIQIAGYQTDEKTGNRDYVNIWIGEDFKIAKGRDGSYILKLKLVDVKEVMRPEDKKPNKNGKREIATESSFDDDGYIPFA